MTGLLGALLVGCSSAPVPTPSASPTGAFAVLVDTYLKDPAAAGYSDAQVQTLERAQSAGELSFEDLSAAVDVTLECISEAGFHVERNATDESQGYPMTSYFYEGPESGNPVADKCIHENSEAIEAIYQLQPTSVEASNAHLASEIDALKPCLAKLGVTLDVDGLEGDELSDALFHLIQSEQLELLESGGTIPGPVEHCFIGIGY